MRILAGYMIESLVRAFIVSAVAVGALLWLMELLQVLEQGLSGVGGIIMLAFEAFLIVPEGVVDLLPVITVLATAAAMSGFQARNELTIMRASGLSIWRLTAVALIPGFGIALLALAALQWVTPLVHQGPERVIGAALGESGLWHPWHGLWMRQGDEFLNVQSLHLGRIPTEINLYQFSPDGELQRHVKAEQALVQSDGVWRMENVHIRRLSDREPAYFEQRDELLWESFLGVRQLELLLSPPASLPLSDLWQYVSDLKRRGHEVAEFEMVLWRRLALPLTCLGMVLAAMATSAVPLKSRAVSVRLVGALTLGLGFQLVAELISYTTLVMGWPVVPAAIGPPLVLALFAWWLLRRAR
ncbi:MAG: LptF/LptG family permease [Wenzhouxiangella sp.]|nr:MAG: LptF/LptG family permease [Wenzhouxiangella sp.]